MIPVDVVLGALLGFVAAYLLARFQASREDRYRYALLKQSKYAEFLRLVREHARTLQLQMDLRVANPMQPVQGVPSLGSTSPIDLLTAEFAILAKRPIWESSRDLYDAVVALDAYAWDDEKPPTYLHAVGNVVEYPTVLGRFNAAQSRFMEEASWDLGTARRPRWGRS